MNSLHAEVAQALADAAETMAALADALCDQHCDSWADAGLIGRPTEPKLATTLYSLATRLEDVAEAVR